MGREWPRRHTWSRVVLVLAVIAAAALVILIVVGTLTSDTTDEIGHATLVLSQPGRR